MNDFDSLIDLVKYDKELIFAPDKHGWTPLHTAASTGNILMITLFVENGADALSKNHDDQTPRDLLSLSRSELIADGDDSSVKKYEFAESILKDAEDKKGIYGDLIDRKRLRSSFKIISKFPKLARRFIQLGLQEPLQELFSKDESLKDDVDDFGWTLLHEAVRFGRVEMLPFLKDSGVDVHERTRSGETVMHIANEFWKNVDPEKYAAIMRAFIVNPQEIAETRTLRKRIDQSSMLQ